MKNKVVTILAIDDIQDNILVLKVLISEAFPSAIFYSATSGREGIEQCKLYKPDVVLLDIAMPGMDGYEVCKIIKADEQLKHIQVVMVTSTTVTGKNRILAMDAGADAFLAKPVDESELTAQIRAMLRIKEAEDHKISEKERLEILVQERTMELLQELADRKKAEDALQQSLLKLEKSRNSELKLLTDLRSEIIERKRVEEQVINHLHDQQIISEVARTLVSIKSIDGVYEYIGERIHEVTNNAYVLVVKANIDNQTISISHSFGLQKLIGKIKRTIGFDVLSLKVSLANLNPEQQNLYKSRELAHITQDPLYTISAHSVDAMICKAIEKLVGITSLYSIGFIWEDQLFGGIAIICRDNAIIKQHKLVETITNLGSIALQRLKAEEHLQKEHANLNAILSSSPVSMLVIDEHAQIVKANPAASRLFNTNLQNIEKRMCGEFLGCVNRLENDKGCGHSSNCAACSIMNSIERALNHQLKSIDQESEIIRETQTGTIRLWLQFSIEPLLLNGKKHLILALHDNTLRKKAEEEKLKTEKRYRSLIEHAPDGIVLIDISGEMKFASNSAMRMFGYDANKLSNLKPNELTHPDDQKIVLAALNDLILNPLKVHTLEYRFKHADGSWHWIQSVFSNLLSDKSVEAIVINFRDITESVTAAEALKISESKYRGLFEANKDGISIFYVNPDNSLSNFVEVNAAAAEMAGYSREEFLQFSVVDLEINSNSLTIEERQHEILEKGFVSIETKIKHKKGHLIDIELLIIPIEFNKKIALMNIVRDITERKQAEDKLQEKEEQLLTLINTTIDIVGFKDGKGRWLKSNMAQLELFHLKNCDYYLKTDAELADFTHPVFREAFLNCLTSDEVAWQSKKMTIIEESVTSVEGDVRIFEVAKTPLFYPDGSRKGLVIFGRDITSRKHNEEALKQSEQKYRLLADNVSDVIWTMDKDFKFTYISPSIFQLRGLTQEEALNENFAESMTEESLKKVRDQIINSLNEKPNGQDTKPSILDIQQNHKNGTLIWVEISVKYIFNSENERIGAVGVSRDVTKRKLAEAELKESRQQLMDIIDFLPDATFVIDNDKKVIAWNKAIEEMTGVSKTDMIGKGNHAYSVPFYGRRQRLLLDLIDTDDNELKARYSNFHRKGNSISAEIFAPELFRGKGAFLSNISAPLLNSNGDRLGYIESIRDITESRKALQALEESEEKYRSMVDLLPDAVIIHSDGKVLFANAAALKLVKIKSLKQITTKSLLDFIHPDSINLARKRINQILLTGKPSSFAEERIITNDNEIIEVEVIGIPVTYLNKPAIQTIARDITLRKKAEQELKLKDELLHLTGDMAKVGGWEFDAVTKQGTWTDEVARIHDLPADTLTNTETGIIFYKNESRIKITEAIQAAIDNGTPYDLELEMTSAKGINKWVRTMGVPVRSGNKTIKIRGIYQDITNRKEAELVLENERLRLRTLIKTIPDLIWLKDPEGKFLLCNPIFETFIGVSEADLTGKTDFDFEKPELAEISKQRDIKLMQHNNPITYEEWVTRRSDGKKCLIETIKSPMFDTEGKLIGILGVGRDITQYFESKESLREREEIYSTIVNQAYDAIVMVDIETGDFIEFNDAACSRLGYSREEFEKLTLKDIELSIKPESIKQTLHDLQLAIAAVFETKHRTSTGEIRDMRVSSRVITIRGIDYLSTIWTDITEKNKSEALLREKDLIFQSLLEYSPVHLFFKDHDSKAMHLSRNYEVLLGKPLSEIIGKNAHEVFPAEYADNLVAGEKQMFIDGKLIEYNETLNGRFYTTIKFPIFRDDALPMLAGFTIDITDRKLAEEALKENEEKLLTLINSSPDIICFKDAENRWIQANKTILDLFQLQNFDYFNKTEKELATLTASIFKEAFDNCDISDEIAWNNETGARTEEIIPDINGSLHVYDIIKRPLYYADKKRKGLVVFGREITERKMTEEALLERESLLRTFIDHAPFEIWARDKNGIGTLENKLLVDHFGSILGKKPENADQSEEIIKLWNSNNQRAMNGEILNLECVYEIKGVARNFQQILAPIYIDGSVEGIAGFNIDITDRKHAEAEIYKLNSELEQRVHQRTRQLEQANKELEAFSYSVSHDLRAPLRGIDGWSLALLEDYYEQLDEQGRVFLDRVRSEAQRMGHLIDDLLKLSRVSRFEMKQVDVNLSELAQTITNRLVETNANRKFDIRIEQDLIAVCDSAMLEIVLTNLFDNACKFSGLEPESMIEFGKLEADEMIIFYIRDNGVGFDMENARNLFGAFQRMHKQTEFQGSGIGLATVQRIIHRHGGRIWAESRAGEGAVFYFTLL